MVAIFCTCHTTLSTVFLLIFQIQRHRTQLRAFGTSPGILLSLLSENQIQYYLMDLPIFNLLNVFHIPIIRLIWLNLYLLPKY